MATDAKTLDRLQKLIELAAHPNTPEHEAASAGIRACKLIKEHAIQLGGGSVDISTLTMEQLNDLLLRVMASRPKASAIRKRPDDRARQRQQRQAWPPTYETGAAAASAQAHQYQLDIMDRLQGIYPSSPGWTLEQTISYTIQQGMNRCRYQGRVIRIRRDVHPTKPTKIVCWAEGTEEPGPTYPPDAPESTPDTEEDAPAWYDRIFGQKKRGQPEG